MSTTVTYKGNTLATVNNNTKTLKTAGKYMEGDVTLTDTTATIVVSETLDANGGIIKTITTTDEVNLQTKTITPTSSVQTVNPDTGYDGFSQVIVNAGGGGGSTINNQNKSVTPSETEQSITADSGYTGLGTVTVGAISSTYVGSGITRNPTPTVSGATVTIPAGYYSSQTTKSVSSGSAGTPTATKGTVSNNSISITPKVTNTTGYITGGTKTGTAVSVTASELVSGNKSITANGTDIDVTNYATVSVSVPTGSTINNQNKSVSPTESEQSVTFDSGYTGLGTVTVNAISSTYVGSDITVDPTPTASGATVTIPEGYYSESTTKTISSGSATTPATTITATQSISIDTSTGEITATASGSKNVTPTVSAGYVSSGTAGTITVNGSDTLQLTTQAAKTVTPTESSQTAVAKNVYTTGVVTVGAISSTYVGSGITQRDSDDLTVSGATVTAPAGYYSAAASKSVSSMTLPTAAASSATSGYSRKATISRSTSVQYINIPTGYNSAGAYYQISAVPNGSVTAPSSISGSSASLTTGTNTLTLTKTVSVTPNVTTEGYISSGTAGNSSVSLTASVTTKAATTYNTSTSNQTIAAGTYLTGAQTIRAVTTSNLSAANVKSGVVVTVGDSADADRVASVTGTFTSDATATAADIAAGTTAYVSGSKLNGALVIQKYYTGSSAPSSSLGNNGDIYIQA